MLCFVPVNCSNKKILLESSFTREAVGLMQQMDNMKNLVGKSTEKDIENMKEKHNFYPSSNKKNQQELDATCDTEKIRSELLSAKVVTVEMGTGFLMKSEYQEIPIEEINVKSSEIVLVEESMENYNSENLEKLEKNLKDEERQDDLNLENLKEGLNDEELQDDLSPQNLKNSMKKISKMENEIKNKNPNLQNPENSINEQELKKNLKEGLNDEELQDDLSPQKLKNSMKKMNEMGYKLENKLKESPKPRGKLPLFYYVILIFLCLCLFIFVFVFYVYYKFKNSNKHHCKLKNPGQS
jgi:hypothetical protein